MKSICYIRFLVTFRNQKSEFVTCVEILYSVILLECCKSPLKVTLNAMCLSSTVVDDGIFKRAVWWLVGCAGWFVGCVGWFVSRVVGCERL